jgi:hypothetical protein
VIIIIIHGLGADKSQQSLYIGLSLFSLLEVAADITEVAAEVTAVTAELTAVISPGM